ncbi:GntR domain protein [Desulfobulbus propionicus DSM 2032]|uniref:GntR domain protein n=1 Tax=Desulfobulbus propionicus (strain ATCC 33891 / DSM 2032 / VKM B-1956 / 1pr3) TaxID=577650 RepID=A0A7U3YMP9_DESPD|nr:FadR/GntR family transcriptional regulator [Desulfobulbus propionicus]ADW18068.1 GntR domain protein [Desulfobulbus propionicus DSM 2032]
MPATKEEKKYAYRAIIDRIESMIADGELAPGDRLPPERKLAESLGVSRGSLRQAFHILAERGIIESRQGDGTYLLAPLGGGCSAEAILDAIGEQSGFVHDIIEFRQMIEPLIAALAARRITPEALGRLKIVACDQQRAVIAGREEDSLDAEFHRLLAAGTGNQVVIQVMTTIQSILNESRSTWLQTSARRHASVEGHLRIIDALEAGDAEAAGAAMHDHLAEIERAIFDEPPTE